MRVLLLSGGIDSTCAAFLEAPDVGLTIDYGQVPADAEIAAAAVVAEAAGIRHEVVRTPLSWTGAGHLAGKAPSRLSSSPEWWPYRNQILVTLAAAWCVRRGGTDITVASVAGDGERHVDGTQSFYEALDGLIRMQEGGIRVRTPYLNDDPVDLIRRAGLSESVLAWCHSCHRSNLACSDCPGCSKRRQVLTEAFRDR